MKCALVVSRDFVCSPLPDEQLLVYELSRRGVNVELVCWQDPTYNWSPSDVTLVRAVTDIADQLDAYLAFLHRVASQTLLLQKASALEWNADKWLVLSFLERQGFPVVPTLQIPSGTNLGDLARACQWWDHLMIKPTISWNGKGVLIADISDEKGCEQAQTMIRRAEQIGRKMLMQPCLFLSAGVHQHSFVGGLWSHALVRHGFEAGREGALQARDVAPISPSYAEVLLAKSVMNCIDRQFGPLPCGVVELGEDAGRLFVLDVEIGSPLLSLKWGYSLPWMADLLVQYITFSRQRRIG